MGGSRKDGESREKTSKIFSRIKEEEFDDEHEKLQGDKVRGEGENGTRERER